VGWFGLQTSICLSVGKAVSHWRLAVSGVVVRQPCMVFTQPAQPDNTNENLIAEASTNVIELLEHRASAMVSHVTAAAEGLGLARPVDVAYAKVDHSKFKSDSLLGFASIDAVGLQPSPS